MTVLVNNSQNVSSNNSTVSFNVANSQNNASNNQTSNVNSNIASNTQTQKAVLPASVPENTNKSVNSNASVSQTPVSMQTYHQTVRQPQVQNIQRPVVSSNSETTQTNNKPERFNTIASKQADNISNQVQSNKLGTVPANAPITDKMPQAKDNYHTPDYHIHNAQGWSNDVQTITQNPDGSYNIYFLHSVDGATNPFGPNGQDWEHVTTKDWIHFSDEGISINSHGTNNPNSWKSAWTGSVITNNGDIAGVPKGAEVAYFSGLSKKDGSQNIWGAWSDDGGKTFTHALNDGAPVLAWNQAGASGKKDQERDADVIYWNNELLMYCAEGDQLGVYKSTDGVHWTKADPSGQSKVLGSTFFRGLNWTSADIPVECPQIRTMKTPNGQTKTVLFYGTKGASDNPAQTTGTYYIVGHLDQNGLFVPETNARRLDLGSDYYGTNVNGNDSLNDAHSSLIGLGWVGNWNYTSQGVYDNQNAHQYPADKSQLENHLGAYTLPRTLVLGNNLQISATPDVHLNEGQTYNATTNKPSNANGQKEDMGKDNNYGDVYDLIDHANDPADQIYNLHFSTTNGSNYQGRIYININQGKDRLTFNYDPDNGMMMVNGYAEELDNDISGSKASSSYYDGALGKGQGYLVNTGYVGNNGQHKQYDIEVFCDKTSVELFFPNGQVYTVARYATNDTQDFKVYTQDPNGVNQVTETKQSLIPATQTSNCSSNGKNDPSGLFPGDSNEYTQSTASPNKPTSNKPSTSSSKPTGTTNSKPSTSSNSSSDNKPAASTGNTNKPASNPDNKGTGSSSTQKPVSGNTGSANNKPSTGTSSDKPASSNNGSSQKPSTTTNKPTTNQTPSSTGSSANKPSANNGNPGSKSSGTSTNGQPNTTTGNDNSGKPVNNESNGQSHSTNSSAPSAGSSTNNGQGSSSANGSTNKPDANTPVNGSTPTTSSNGQPSISGSTGSAAGSAHNNTNGQGTTDKGSTTNSSTPNVAGGQGTTSSVSDNSQAGQPASSTSISSGKGTDTTQKSVEGLNATQSGKQAIGALNSQTRAGQSAHSEKNNAYGTTNSPMMQYQAQNQNAYASSEQASSNQEIPSAGNENTAVTSESGANGSTGSVTSSVPVSVSSASASRNSSSTNALPETGMADTGITFAAAALALTGVAMLERENKKND